MRSSRTATWWPGAAEGGADFGQCTVPAAAASGVTAIAAGDRHSLALKQDGSVIAWGCGGASDYGQCIVPAAAASGVTAIAAGQYHSLALKQDGSVIVWGCGSSGAVNGDFGQCALPVAVAGGVGAIAAGGLHSLALFPLLAQTIAVTVHAPAVAVYKQSFAVTATSSSGLPVAVSSGSACASSGAMFTMTSGSGTCLVKYDQPGDGTYEAAPQVVESLKAQKAAQTITFGALPPKTYGDPDFSVTANASSGLSVSFVASGSCSVNGGTVHVAGAGSCTVTASQPGDANYNAAADVSQSFATAKANQTIRFDSLANKTYGAPGFTVRATASSGLAVSFVGSGSCTVSGTTVRLTGAGSCTVTASQPGDANYNAAADVSQNFAIARPPCTVPNVVGKRLAAAKLAITHRHCRTGRLRSPYSPKKKGVVTSQSRRAGLVLPADAKVDLVVSRGRKR